MIAELSSSEWFGRSVPRGRWRKRPNESEKNRRKPTENEHNKRRKRLRRKRCGMCMRCSACMCASSAGEMFARLFMFFFHVHVPDMVALSRVRVCRYVFRL